MLPDLEVAEIFAGGRIGWPPQIGGEAPDVADILVLGAGQQSSHHHVVQHSLA
jgi:hypothetical protein